MKPALAEGQVLTFAHAPVETARVVIQKIEPGIAGDDAVHVSVYGLPPFPTGVPGVIAHMPFSRQALEASLSTLTDEVAPADVDIGDGYRNWKEAEGGIFTIPVAQAVRYVVDVAFGPDTERL
jgi:hypothetical protein